MKRLATLFVSLLMASGAFASDPVKDFESLMDILKKGEEVRVVIHYEKCQLISDNEIQNYSPNAIGGMEISTFEYFAPMSIGNEKAFVVTSTSHLIANPIGDGYVYNYVKIKISDDNKVKITARYLHSQTHEEVMTENFFTVINDGKNEGGIMIFED